MQHNFVLISSLGLFLPSGLGPRKFRARAVEVGDQSVWTDTPADKARKVQELFIIYNLLTYTCA